jgi:nicotinamide-nucleotide adenylyltransferase
LIKVGLYIGRFQPFHTGHTEAIKYALKKVDELIIAIGSAQYSYTLDNPFTTGERITMIRKGLHESGIDTSKYQIVPIPDINIHTLWIAYVKSYTPQFDLVFSNEPLTSRLFKEAGIMVERIPYFERNIYSATEIRKRMVSNEDWQSLMPKNVSSYIEKIGGVDRIIELTKTDNPSIQKSKF